MTDHPRPAPLFRGHVTEQGQLIVKDLPRWRGYLARFRDKDVSVQVRRESLHRSLQANAYYWAVVLACAAEWSGHDAEELHLAFKARFLRARQVTLPTGEVLEVPASTRELSIEDFSQYVNQVIRFLAENGVAVPTAEEIA
jgi:hypothetical protein